MLVTGCMRSGTWSIAEILQLGHEKLFTHTTTWKTIKTVQSTAINEASWMAAPFISVIKPRTPVIRVLRHPLAVINSIVGIGFFDLDHQEASLHEPYREFLYSHLPQLRKMLPPEAAAHYYLEWNKKLDGIPSIRIEDILDAPQLNSRTRAEHEWSDVNITGLTEQAQDYGYNVK